MAILEYDTIKMFCDPTNRLGNGKEVEVYRYQDKVIKLFHRERKTTLPRISDQGLITLSELTLNCFLTPKDVIVQDKEIVGYTEEFVEEKDIQTENIPYQEIKADIETLSEQGFILEDIFYNYLFTADTMVFNDLTCCRYMPTDNSFLKERFLKKNMETINIFLIGLTKFDAFHKGEKSEYTKIFLANDYRIKHCPDCFYGDILEQEKGNKF